MTIYSYSQLKCYEQCPKKYKLQYIDRVKINIGENIELFLGKRVHETLKKLYIDLSFNKINSLKDLLGYLHFKWNKNLNDPIVIVKESYTEEDYFKIAEQCITNYYNRYYPFNQDRTIAVEKQIKINLDGTGKYILRGYIDRISKTKDGCYHIHDYKTCSRRTSKEYLNKNRQLALYSIMLMRKYPYIKNVCLTLHFLKFDKEIKTKGNIEELGKVKKDVMKLIDTIEKTEEFLINPSKLCNWCKFKSICNF